MVRYLLSLFTIFFLTSCVEKENSDPYVRVDTGGIYRPVSVSLNGQELPESVNLGEWETATSPILMTLTIKNNTNFPVTNIELSFPGQTNNVYNFAAGAEDDGSFPGFGGTCQTTLASNQSCTIVLQFYTAKSGTYIQEVLLQYKNLVESDAKSVIFSVVAGLPASLIFDDGSTRRFLFGEEVGAAKKPVLERADRIEYHRKLKIKNTGELSAREIFIEKIFLCSSSYESNPTCPTAYQDPWRLVHDCPKELAPLQECTADMYFIPLNQDPESGFNPVLEELNYKGDIKISYKRTPEGGDTSLTGRFETNSTTIQAKFISSKTGIDYGDNVISGNFKIDMFNIRNAGYREGEMRKLIFRKTDDSPLNPALAEVECRLDEIENKIACYEFNTNNLLELKDFPYVVTDRNQCFSNYNADEEEKRFAEIEESCIFELRFQPSTSYVQPYSFAYKLSVEYDARWKGTETIKENELFEIVSHSIQPAKMELFKIEFDGAEKTIENGLALLDIDNQVNLGRLALLSPGYESWRKVTLTFRNVGGIPVSFLKAFVGHEAGHAGAPITEIPKSSDNPNGIAIGPHAAKYFKQMLIDMNNCGSGGAIAPDPDRTGNVPTAYCQVSFLFSPVGMDTNVQEDETMFDLLDTLPKLRVFAFNYHDGSYYSDTNFSNVPDLQTSNINALKRTRLGLTTSLVKSGFLASYYVNGNLNTITRGNNSFKNFIFRNIGTGPITYMPWTGGMIPHESQTEYDIGLRRISVQTPSAYGANYDCNNIFDFDAQESDSLAVIQARLATKQTLGKMESCVLRIEAKEALQFFNADIGSQHRLLALPSNIDYDGTILNHILRERNVSRLASVSYYDGDADGQVSSPDEKKQEFGELIQTGAVGSHLKQPINIQARYIEQLRLVVGNPSPYQSAVIYVPQSTYPSFNYQQTNGTTATRAASNRAAYFFAYENRLTASSSSCDSSSFMFPSCLSPSYVASRLGDTTSYDYIVHAGTFPINKQIPIEFSVLNAGLQAGRLDRTSESFSGANFTLAASYPNNLNMTSSMLGSQTGVIPGGYPVRLLFQASSEGVFEGIYTISYNNGREEEPKVSQLRVKIIAETKSDMPTLAFETHDYQVNPIPGDIPVATLLPSNGPIVSGLNHSASPTKVLIESVKIKQRTIEAAYGKKRIVVKNASATQDMKHVKFMFKDNAVGITDSTRINWSSASTTSAKVVEENCRAKTTLAANDWCYIDIWYQPLEIDQVANFVLSVSYDTDQAPNQYLQNNIDIELVPKMPSVIRVKGLQEQNIAYRKRGQGATVYSGKAFVNQMGDLLYNAVNKSFEFTHILENFSTDTKASLLKQYELHRGLGNTNYGPNDIPAAEYDAGFITIYSRSDMVVQANNVCLFGGSDLNGAPNEERGFYDNSNDDCRIKVIFSPGINSIGRQYLFSSVEDVSDVYIPIKYYNNKRASFDEFIITLTGKVYPDKSSIASGVDPYFNVKAESNGRIELSWQPFTAINSDLGDVIGYRVYYSLYQNDFGDEIAMQTSNAEYVDVRGAETKVEILVSNEPSYYFIYVAAIRYSSSYTRNMFAGLGNGEYLSHSLIPITRLVIPPNDLYFAYKENMLITYERLGNGYARCQSESCARPRYTYNEAIAACNMLAPVSLSSQGLMVEKYFDLVNEDAWDSISSNFLETTSDEDGDMAPHWLKTGLVYDIDALFSGVPGFDPLEISQSFDDPYRMHYRRSNPEHCTTFGTCLVPKVMGMQGAQSPGYVSYIGPGFMIPHARCYVPLD